MLFVPIPPTPMTPIVILLLGALEPKTEEGTIVGTAKTALAAASAELFKKSRRFVVIDFSVILLFIPACRAWNIAQKNRHDQPYYAAN
jgi:hypothetical protein